MKRILVDLNVVLDAALERAPHAEAAAKLWAAIEAKRVDALLPAHGVTTLFYLLAHAKGAAFARRSVSSILGVFGVATVDQAVIQRALALAGRDFEDAVCAAAAESAACDAVVTRDPAGFSGCAVPVMAPETALALLGSDPPDHVAETSTVPHPARAASRRIRRSA